MASHPETLAPPAGLAVPSATDSGTPTPTTAGAGSLVVVTLLFFMWGLITSLNDVLIPHLKAVYTLNYAQAMAVQMCFFSAYFLVSWPAGALIRRHGYQRSAVIGLLVAAAGCALFLPAAVKGYGVFLLALFVLASGITILQVAANPYVAALGPAATAPSRLTLTQGFNSLGTAIGPFVGGLLIFSGAGTGGAGAADSVRGPYLGLALALLVLAGAFAAARLPRLATDAEAGGATTEGRGSLWRERRLMLGVVAIFVYVGGEVSIGSFLVNFLAEPHIAGLSHAAAAGYVSLYWGGAMVGRFVGAAVMRRASPGLTLAAHAVAAIVLLLVVVLANGSWAMWAALAIGLCNSIMFPTIFSLALKDLGPRAGEGSGALCMAIVGGAIVPPLQGALADSIGLQPAFLLPVVCYAFIAYFGWFCGRADR